jgi:galactokinase
LRNELAREFKKRFGNAQGISCFKAPGRVNLIGEHTDYNDGLVLPLAINRYIHFLARKRKDKIVRIYSSNFNELKEFRVDRLPGREGTWSDYIQGLIWAFKRKGGEILGFEGMIYGNIPIGSGLGSSAALEVAVAYGLSKIFDLDIPELELVKLCQGVENEFVGAKCGIMDQYTSFYAKKGKALFLDTRSLSHQFIELPFGEVGILVIDTGIKHSLASSKYNERRKECEESVQLLKSYISDLSSLRDLTPELLDKFQGRLPEPLRRRVRHVVEENIRVKETVKALEKGEMKIIGELLFASHCSLKELYEVSSPELDFLIELARREGILGARMTGAGFGGATIHLLFKTDIPDYRRLVKGEFLKEFGIEPKIFEIKTSDGVKVEDC